MSRVHDALRRAETVRGAGSAARAQPRTSKRGRMPAAHPAGSYAASAGGQIWRDCWNWWKKFPFRTATDSLLIDVTRPHEAPMEEFRTLRTRLNHMKSLQPIHTVVVTSASPAEGKSLTAANLALAESHLAGNITLLADFDFRRPIVHTLFGIDRSPGITDYLMGQVPLHKAIKQNRRNQSVHHARRAKR